MFEKNIEPSGAKKIPSFGFFIVPFLIFLISFPFLFSKNPPFSGLLFASLAIAILVAASPFFYVQLKASRYFQKNNFPLWKKSKSRLLRERIEASELMSNMVTEIPCLKNSFKLVNKIAFAVLIIWTVIFIIVSSFIIFSAR